MERLGFKKCECINPDYLKWQQTIEELKEYQKIYEKFGVTDKLKDFRFEMYKLQVFPPVLDLVDNKKFIDENGITKTGFLFWSTTSGTGKTLLALSIANSLAVDFKLSVRYENTIMLFSKLKNYYNMDRDNQYYNELDYLEELAAYDVLILDDIGSEKCSEWVREKLYFVIEKRNLDPNKINIYTSNDSPEILAAKVGEKIVSRMFEYAKVIEFTDSYSKDWRQIKK